MKKIFSYILAFVCAAAAVSCVEEEIRQEPQMNLSETEIVLGPEGGEHKIVYELIGVAENAAVNISNDASWLEVSTARARLIEVSAEKNDTGAERKAEFIVADRKSVV